MKTNEEFIVLSNTSFNKATIYKSKTLPKTATNATTKAAYKQVTNIVCFI